MLASCRGSEGGGRQYATYTKEEQRRASDAFVSRSPSRASPSHSLLPAAPEPEPSVPPNPNLFALLPPASTTALPLSASAGAPQSVSSPLPQLPSGSGAPTPRPCAPPDLVASSSSSASASAAPARQSPTDVPLAAQAGASSRSPTARASPPASLLTLTQQQPPAAAASPRALPELTKPSARERDAAATTALVVSGSAHPELPELTRRPSSASAAAASGEASGARVLADVAQQQTQTPAPARSRSPAAVLKSSRTPPEPATAGPAAKTARSQQPSDAVPVSASSWAAPTARASEDHSAPTPRALTAPDEQVAAASASASARSATGRALESQSQSQDTGASHRSRTPRSPVGEPVAPGAGGGKTPRALGAAPDTLPTLTRPSARASAADSSSPPAPAPGAAPSSAAQAPTKGSPDSPNKVTFGQLRRQGSAERLAVTSAAASAPQQQQKETSPVVPRILGIGSGSGSQAPAVEPGNTSLREQFLKNRLARLQNAPFQPVALLAPKFRTPVPSWSYGALFALLHTTHTLINLYVSYNNTKCDSCCGFDFLFMRTYRVQ